MGLGFLIGRIGFELILCCAFRRAIIASKAFFFSSSVSGIFLTGLGFGAADGDGDGDSDGDGDGEDPGAGAGADPGVDTGGNVSSEGEGEGGNVSEGEGDGDDDNEEGGFPVGCTRRRGALFFGGERMKARLMLEIALAR